MHPWCLACLPASLLFLIRHSPCAVQGSGDNLIPALHELILTRELKFP